MIRKNPSGDLPFIHESAYVDNTAILCGKIVVEENVFIGPYAVIRADEVNELGEMEAIIIGANSNIQDGVVIHSKAGGLVKIGANTSIAHRSIVHGPCIVGENVFIGFNSVLFDCLVGNGSVVRHNSVVEHCEIPENFHIPSTTNVHSNQELSNITQVSAQASDFSESVLKANLELVKGYKKLQNEF
ncbi:MAG: carbonate dehydratase [Sulfuricella denitrificans]|nr:carbonate dehydratase [Sulfuricella denitrificans]